MGKRKGMKKEEHFSSDDERKYQNEDVPDADDDDFYNDEVEQFHSNREKIMLDGAEPVDEDEMASDEEEVLAFDDDTSDEEDRSYQMMKKQLTHMRRKGLHGNDIRSDSDDDKKNDDDDDEVHKKWGSEKRRFYGGNDSDPDEDLSDDELAAAELEEIEALAIQKRLLQDMDDDDIGFEMFKPAIKESVESSEKITQDLTKMTKKEKLQLLTIQSPELLELIEDHKIRVHELQSRLLPVYNLIKDKKISSKSSGAKLVISKVEVYLNYLINFSYYLMLKAKQTAVEHHPVIKRLLQYRNIMKQIDSVEERFSPVLDALLQRIKDGEEFTDIDETNVDKVEEKPPPVSEELPVKKKFKSRLIGQKRLAAILDDDLREEMSPDVNKGGRTWGRKRSKTEVETEFPIQDPEIPADVGEGEGNDGEGEGNDGEEGRNEGEERRGINFEIEKNKGLHARKRKELRNPRVKHRLKYRKAQIRRRGQVREVRTEMDKYGGELSGIRAGMKKSIKFRS